MSITPAEPPPALSTEDSSTIMFKAPPAWSQPTVEVSLEARAQAGLGAAAPERAVFEEVFDEPPAAEPVPVVSAPEPPAPAPEPAAAAPAAPPSIVEESFADLAPQTPEPAPHHSAAAEVAVPVDMVAQIAQRVVAQISEKVVREVAWEVIPDLAEALIRKEIERLKAELQQT
jgi:hypothetical protein